MKAKRVLGCVVAGAFMLAACGSDDDDGESAATSAAAASSAAASTSDAPATSGGDAAATTDESATSATSAAPTSDAAPSTAPVEVIPVRFTVNPGQIAWLPYFVAVDKGYFEDEGLDVSVAKHNQNTASQYPLLGRNDLDIAPAVPGPPLSNLFSEGFKIKLVAATSAAEEGYLSNTVLMATPDAAANIDDVADLAGLKIDAAAEGSNADLLVKKALEKGGLTPDDVTLTYTGKTPPDMVQNLASGAVDVQSVVEPFATQAENDGVGVKVFATYDVQPGFQEAFVAVSEGFYEEHPDGVVRFLRAMRRAMADLNASGGEWTDDIVAIASEWTTIPAETIKGLGRMPYYPADMQIDIASFEDAQQFYVDGGLVTQPVDTAELIDTELLAEASR